MTFSDAVTFTAVPVTPTPAACFDPDNPSALGYDAGDEALRTARAATAGDQALARAFEGQLRRETARFRDWCDDYRRRGAGGCARVSGPIPFAPADPAELLGRAIRCLDRRRRWRASPQGLAAAALTRAETTTEALAQALSQARDAADRDDGSLSERAEAASRLAETLVEAVRGLRAAAGGSATPTERGAPLPRFTAEMCASPSRPGTSRTQRLEG